MKGRIETKIKTESHISTKISESGFPYVDGYYHSMVNYEHKSKETYINYVLSFLSSVNKPVEDITDKDIYEYFDNKMYRVVNGELKEYSGTYRGTIHTALSDFFAYLVRNKIVSENVIEKYPRPKPKKSSEVKRKFIKDEIVQGIIDTVKKERNEVERRRNLLIIMLFLCTGIRRQALVEINIDDVNTEEKKLTVFEKRRKIRTFELDDTIIELYLQVADDVKRVNPDCEALFISNRKTRISGRTVDRIIDGACESLHISPHVLRRYFGTNLYKEVRDIYLTQQALGHERIDTTMLYVPRDDTSAAKKGMNAVTSKIKF